MIFFCDNSGQIFKTVPENVYQGSVNANTIYFVGAFDGGCVVTARFELPNGLITSEQIMSSAYLALDDDIQTESGEKYGVWSLALKYPVTELSGTVNVQFSVTNANENGVAATVCTAISSFNVEKGVPILQETTVGNYQDLLSEIKAAIVGAKSLIAQKLDIVQPVAKQSFTVVSDSGDMVFSVHAFAEDKSVIFNRGAKSRSNPFLIQRVDENDVSVGTLVFDEYNGEKTASLQSHMVTLQTWDNETEKNTIGGLSVTDKVVVKATNSEYLFAVRNDSIVFKVLPNGEVIVGEDASDDMGLVTKRQLEETVANDCGTIVTVDGEKQVTWNADTKLDRKPDGTVLSACYGTSYNGKNIMRQVAENRNRTYGGELAMYVNSDTDWNGEAHAALWTATPQFDGQAANKAYVDTTTANINTPEKLEMRYILGLKYVSGQPVPAKYWCAGVDQSQFGYSMIPMYWDERLPYQAENVSVHLFTGTPTHKNHAANKEYVDATRPRLYKHTVTVTTSIGPINNGEFMFIGINENPNPYCFANSQMALTPYNQYSQGYNFSGVALINHNDKDIPAAGRIVMILCDDAGSVNYWNISDSNISDTIEEL